MKGFLRSTGAIVAGFLAASITVAILEGLSSLIYPLPAGVSASDSEAIREFVRTLPASALLLVLGGWMFATFLGGLIAARIAGRAHAVHALVVAAIIVAASAYNLSMFEHPTWMWIGTLLGLPATAFFGAVGAPSRFPAHAVPTIASPNSGQID